MFSADIRKTPIEEATVDLGNNITGYKYRNLTKYYENDIIFVSQNRQPLSLLPGDIVSRLEGCIVYFDAHNVSLYTNQKCRRSHCNEYH